MSRGLPVVRRPAASSETRKERMSAIAVRERLTRLGAPPSPRPRPVRLLPHGFEEVATRFGTAVVREDVIPLPPLEPHPGNVAYLDTETTGLSGASGTLVFAATVAPPAPSRPRR